MRGQIDPARHDAGNSPQRALYAVLASGAVHAVDQQMQRPVAVGFDLDVGRQARRHGRRLLRRFNSRFGKRVDAHGNTTRRRRR